MKSRRRIAFAKAQDYAQIWLCFWRVQQEIAIGGIGFKDEFALQQS
jgi:hypothetical protein